MARRMAKNQSVLIQFMSSNGKTTTSHDGFRD
jgi:hypothetical protein